MDNDTMIMQNKENIYKYGDQIYEKQLNCPIERNIGWFFILGCWIPILNVFLFGFMLSNWKKALIRLGFYLFGSIAFVLAVFFGAMIFPESTLVIAIVGWIILLGIYGYFLIENLYLGFKFLGKDDDRFKVEMKYAGKDKMCFLPKSQIMNVPAIQNK